MSFEQIARGTCKIYFHFHFCRNIRDANAFFSILVDFKKHTIINLNGNLLWIILVFLELYFIVNFQFHFKDIVSCRALKVISVT